MNKAAHPSNPFKAELGNDTTSPHDALMLPSLSRSLLFFRYGAQGLTLSKIVPHICNLLGDPTSQVCAFVVI